MKKKIRIFLPIIVIILSILIVKILKATKPQPEQAKTVSQPLSLFVESVRKEAVRLKVTSEGEVIAKKQLKLISQVTGKVTTINPNFEEGGAVAANEILFSIEDADYQYAVVQTKAGVASAKLDLEQSFADADVAKQQLTKDTSKYSPLALKQPQINQAKAQLAAAEAQLQQAKLNLSRTQISVPFNSRIRKKQVEIGQFISVGSVLGEVFSTDVAEVKLAFNDKQLASLGLPIGFNATELTAPKVILNASVAGKTQKWVGRLVRLSADLDSKTRLVYGYVQIEDPYGKAAEQAGGMPLAIGLYVNAEIEGQSLAQAYIIPREALRQGNKVYVVNNGKLDIRYVKVIDLSGNRVVLQSGVSESEQVVVSPVSDVTKGMAIEPVSKGSEVDSKNNDIAMKVEF